MPARSRRSDAAIRNSRIQTDTPEGRNAGTIFILTETTDRTGYTLAVFADCAMALDAARSHGRHRAERCRAGDAMTFGKSEPTETYQIVVTRQEPNATIFLVHVPSGERDACAWHVNAFDVVEPCTASEVELFDAPA